MWACRWWLALAVPRSPPRLPRPVPIAQGRLAWRVRVDRLVNHKSIMIGACLSERAHTLAKSITPHSDEGFFGICTYGGSFQDFIAGKTTEYIRGQGAFFEAGEEVCRAVGCGDRDWCFGLLAPNGF